MSNLYLGWQLKMDILEESVKSALQRYYDRFGYPPSILLKSSKLETLPVPEGMNLVVQVQSLPKNILLLGEIKDEH